MPVPGRTILDHLVEYVVIMAMIDTTCGRAARELRELMKEEFGEVEEPVPPGSVGSSTMPQKRNPKLCQDIMADETHVRSLVPLAFESMLSDHEADGSRAVMLGRALAPAIELTGDILVRMNELIEGLRVFPERMRRNLDLSGGLIMSESLMLTLGRELGRQRAHDAVYEAAQEAAVSGEPFADLLAARPEVQGHLDEARIATLLDPTAYTGESAHQATEQAARAREVAAKIRAGAS
jgi:adenylosuccinate lyase